MGTENAQAEIPQVGVDPKGWIEPSEVFPGEVLVSQIRLCDEKYAVKTDYRPAFPRLIKQWDLRIKAYDRVIQLLDGQRVDAVRYGGYDLERMREDRNTGEWELSPINIRSNKEALISNAWIAVFGSIEPVTQLVGKKAMFEFFPQKRVGRRTASNVLLPLSALPPNYTYTGEVQVIVKRTPEGEEQGTAVNATVNGTELKATSVQELAQLLNGTNANQPGTLVGAIPPQQRTGDIINGLLDGSLITELVEKELITKAVDGTLTAA